MDEDAGVAVLDVWAAFVFLPGLSPGFSLLMEADEGGGDDPFLCFEVSGLEDVAVLNGSL